MRKNKGSSKLDISKIIESIFEKKMELFNAEIKKMILKTSEEYFSNALQSINKEEFKTNSSRKNQDNLNGMNMSESQIFGSLLNKINSIF